MATYRSQLIVVPSPEPQGYAASLRMTERPVYGSSRLGTYARWEELYDHPVVSTPAPDPVQPVDLNYELTDHLGNVTAVVTGRLLNGNGGGTPKQAELVSAQGYEAFGALLPGRNYSSNSYRFGFNGKRKDDEIHGALGTSYDFGARIYDPRVGRWLSIDPLKHIHPGWSPYRGFLDNPIIYTDKEGKTEYLSILIRDERTGKVTAVHHVVSEQVFPDPEVHMISDGLGGYYNATNWYDRQTEISVTIGLDGSVQTTTTSRLLKDSGPRETTAGPLRTSSNWANLKFAIRSTEWDVPEGEGGVQRGGYYLMGEGAPSPTKFKSLSHAEPRDLGELLAVLGSLSTLKGMADFDKLSKGVISVAELRQSKDGIFDYMENNSDSQGRVLRCKYCEAEFFESQKDAHPEGERIGFEVVREGNANKKD